MLRVRWQSHGQRLSVQVNGGSGRRDVFDDAVALVADQSQTTSWTIGAIYSIDAYQSVDRRRELVVDSGACANVCGVDAFFGVGTRSPERVLCDVQGKRLDQKGVKDVVLETTSGRRLNVAFETAFIDKDVLSVHKLLENGISVVFTPDKQYLTKAKLNDHPPAAHREDSVRKHGLFYLNVKEPVSKVGMIGPLLEHEVQVDEELDRMMAPFGPFEGGPEAPQERRDPDEVGDDEERQLQPLPDRGEQQLDLDPQALPVRATEPPSLEAQRLHDLTHLLFQSWCDECVEARGRELHLRRRQPRDAVPVVHCDYTSWTKGVAGWDIAAAVQVRRLVDKSTSFTAVDVNTGMICSTIVQRKGAWPYLVDLMVEFMRELQYDKVVLQGDGEPSLQKLLTTVAERLRPFHVDVEVQTTAPAEPQSIGCAENGHQRLGGMVRTLLAVLRNRVEVDVSPEHVLFPWLLRHAVHLLNNYSTSSSGTTPYRACHGRDPKESLVQFGECVHVKTQGHELGKCHPRWYKAIFVGFHRQSSSYIVLTRRGRRSPEW